MQGGQGGGPGEQCHVTAESQGGRSHSGREEKGPQLREGDREVASGAVEQ